MSVGYEVAITPLQTLTFYNAIANNGKMVKPQFIKEIHLGGKTTQKFETVVLKESIVQNPETLAKVRNMLEGVVERGTATNLRNPVYKIAGKTGTAQIAQQNSGYNKSNYKASFVGYFPADNPKYTCIVVINNPRKGVYYGGSIAGPVFREIADKVYATRLDPVRSKTDTLESAPPLLAAGYAKDLETIFRETNVVWKGSSLQHDFASLNSSDSSVQIKPLTISETQIPDVTGMGARDAVYLLENAGVKVQIKGKGLVKKQSLPAGTKSRRGSQCIIELG
jgi:cell division protein FtsI (penicillin-binding protein 3)